MKRKYKLLKIKDVFSKSTIVDVLYRLGYANFPIEVFETNRKDPEDNPIVTRTEGENYTDTASLCWFDFEEIT